MGCKLESVGGLLPPGQESWPGNRANAEKQTNDGAGAERFMTPRKHLNSSVPAVFSVTRAN